MAQFMSLQPDILRYIVKTFPGIDQQARAKALVEAAVLHDGRPASPRCQRAALIAAHGSLRELAEHVDHLAIDFRDVILAGEYAPPTGAGLQKVRDLNEAFQDV